MIGDKFTQFQLAVMEQGGVFDFFKSSMVVVEKAIEKNFGGIQKAGASFGKTLVKIFEDILMGSARVLDFLTPMFKFISNSISNIIDIGKNIPSPFDTLGVLGFLMLGRKGKGILLIIGGFIDHIRAGFGHILSGMIAIEEFGNRFTLDKLLNRPAQKEFEENMKRMKKRVKELQTPMEDLKNLVDGLEGNKNEGVILGFDVTLGKTTALQDKMKSLLAQIKAVTNETKEIEKKSRFFADTTDDQRALRKLKKEFTFFDETDDARAGRKNEIEEVGMLEKAYKSFNRGFKESVEAQQSGFKTIEDIGGATFGKLKQTLTDFVMTGKMNIGDLARFVVKSFIEMLVGEAVKMAFKKSLAMFKAKSIKEAMISLFSGAMKTFASIPFPFNVVAVGGALAFGGSLINKLKSFEKGGRPPIGQPSIVGEKGMELFVPNQAGTIIPNDKLGGSQPVTVNFNISTVDARGFNELLLNSRGAIVNIINSAVNEKGRMAIV
tara:strand:- start:214 stop:1692 length:1479 start_codon:yes stop_codon:yes gene_type:complete